MNCRQISRSCNIETIVETIVETIASVEDLMLAAGKGTATHKLWLPTRSVLTGHHKQYFS